MPPVPQTFRHNPAFTLGVELELQLVNADPSDFGGLANCIGPFLQRVPDQWKDSFKHEFMQCFCEINAGVCHSVAEVERDLTDKLQWAQSAARDMGLALISAGSHPFSRWEQQQITPGERYQWLLNAMQDVARRLLTFGLHVHVGVDSGDKAVHLCDRLLKHIPTLLALSVNSPFWCGRDSGLQSYRSKVIEALPTAGLPGAMRNWSEYVWLVDHLIRTKFINSIREIWWDVRPHAGFGTVEMRVMDMPMNLQHTLGIVALTQSLVAALSESIDDGAYQFDSHPMIVKQNKWHAARYGMEAQLVEFDQNGGVSGASPATVVARKLIDRVGPYAERLGCLTQLNYLDDILQNGTGAARQRKVFEETSDLRQVVKLLTQQATTATA